MNRRVKEHEKRARDGEFRDTADDRAKEQKDKLLKKLRRGQGIRGRGNIYRAKGDTVFRLAPTDTEEVKAVDAGTPKLAKRVAAALNQAWIMGSGEE